MAVMLVVLGGAGDLALKKLVDPIERLLERHPDLEVRLADLGTSAEFARRWEECRSAKVPDAWGVRYRTVDRAPSARWLEEEASALAALARAERQELRIVVYLALSPHLYQEVILAYASLAGRGYGLTFGIEKPLALSDSELDDLHATVKSFEGRIRVDAVDHYLGKWAVLVADSQRSNGVVERLLRRFDRATLRLLESGGIPADRLWLYNGLGCFCDVFPHLASCLFLLTGHLVGDRQDGRLDWNGVLGQLNEPDLSKETYFCLQFDDHHADGEPCRIVLQSGKRAGESNTKMRFETDVDEDALSPERSASSTAGRKPSVVECDLRAPSFTIELADIQLSYRPREASYADDAYLIVFQRLLAGEPLGLSLAEQARVIRRMLQIAQSASFIAKQESPIPYQPGCLPPCAVADANGLDTQAPEAVR